MYYTSKWSESRKMFCRTGCAKYRVTQKRWGPSRNCRPSFSETKLKRQSFNTGISRILRDWFVCLEPGKNISQGSTSGLCRGLGLKRSPLYYKMVQNFLNLVMLILEKIKQPFNMTMSCSKAAKILSKSKLSETLQVWKFAIM